MKKISAVFDGLKFSAGTLAYGLKLAQSSRALLSGVFLESFLYKSYVLDDLIGTQGLSQVKMKNLLEKDKMTRQGSVDIFEQACKKAQLNYTIHRDENLAIQEIRRESIYSDLLVLSADESLSHLPDQRPTHFIRELLEGTLCPVLIVPPVYQEIEKVFLLYDGKPAAVHAIKMFYYLMPWLRGKETEVLTVTDLKDRSEMPDEALVKEFIDCHCPAATFTLLEGDPEDMLVRYLNNASKNSLIVAGCYQRNDVSRWFKSSMADRLMAELDLPLFVAHH